MGERFAGHAHPVSSIRHLCHTSTMHSAATIIRTALRLLPFLAAFPLIAQPEGAPGTGGAPAQRELDGRILAGEIVQAVGGLNAWNDRSWDLSFDFVVMHDGAEAGRVSHFWNRSTDGYVVGGMTKDGSKWEVNFADIMNKVGMAMINGAPVADSLRQKTLDMGYGRFINDTYWLLMPFKLLDSGVYHYREPDTTIGGQRYEVLRLSFGNVGLTPGDRYWLYVDPETKLVRRWRFRLQGSREGDYLWNDYTDFDSIRLSLSKPAVDGTSEIRFEHVQVMHSGRRKSAGD